MRAESGYSLIELVVVIVVLSLALTGVTLVITRTVQQSPEALVQTRAMELAQTYMDEILTKRFDEQSGQGGIPRCDSTDNAQSPCSNSFGPDGAVETDRRQYDDVDDYHNLNELPPLSIVSGAPITLYDGYRVQVAVAYAGSDLGLASNRGAKRITISVTTPLGNVIPVSAYRLNF